MDVGLGVYTAGKSFGIVEALLDEHSQVCYNEI